MNGFWINGKTVFASNAWFSEQLNCNDRTIQKCLEQLESEGILARRIEENGRRHILPGDAPGGRGGTSPKGVHTINSISNTISADAQNLIEKDSDAIVEVPSDSDGGVAEPRAARQKADVSYRKVFALWGKYPRNWDLNRTQIQAAKNLLAEHDLPLIRGALKFHSEMSEHVFCPNITSPYDLDSKWKKLAAFKKKLDL